MQSDSQLNPAAEKYGYTKIQQMIHAGILNPRQAQPGAGGWSELWRKYSHLAVDAASQAHSTNASVWLRNGAPPHVGAAIPGPQPDAAPGPGSVGPNYDPNAALNAGIPNLADPHAIAQHLSQAVQHPQGYEAVNTLANAIRQQGIGQPQGAPLQNPGLSLAGSRLTQARQSSIKQRLSAGVKPHSIGGAPVASIISRLFGSRGVSF